MDEAKANKIIASNRPLISLVKYFRNGMEVLWYFAGVMGKQFQQDKVEPECCICMRNRASQIRVFYWMAKVHRQLVFSIFDVITLLGGLLRFKIDHDIVSFPTTHGFCEPCLVKVKRNQMYAGMVWAASLLMLCFCVRGTLISGAAAVMMWSDSNDRNLWLKIVLAGMIGVIFATFGQIFARRLRIPASMRHIGRRPFYLMGIDDADNRHTN